MKTPADFCPDEALDDAAAAWLCERDEGFTPERARAFADWREQDPRHETAITRVERALALIGEMPAVRAPLEARFGRASEMPAPVPASGFAGTATAPGRIGQFRRRAVAVPVSTYRGHVVRFRLPAWFAAVAAALVVGGIAWWSFSPRAPAGEHYATDAAAQKRVALGDGSIVDLNAASDVRVQFNARERRVSLGAGEAHFQVAADAARPFVVTAGGVSVRAVGTAFNVRMAGESVEVLVVEGKVEVARADAAWRASAAARSLLTAGERTHVSRDDPAAAPKIEKAPPESIRAALAWHDPMTTFNDVPLREVVSRLNQRNATQLMIDDAQLAERKIGCVIALDQVEAFVRLLEQDGDIVAERRGASEIRLRRAR